MKISKYLLPLFLGLALVSCNEDDDNTPETNDGGYDVPAQYVFEDSEGNSTVSFGGQTDRLNQLAAMTTLMKTGNTAGTDVSAADLTDMFANVNGDGNGNFDFTSTKQLKNKCGSAFIDANQIKDKYEGWMNELAELSSLTTEGENNAENGIAGTLVSGESGPYLVNEFGFELTQLVEKGLMGAVFYHQITGVYLSDDKIGNAVDNTTIVEGKNYTTMEHHWDEAFGYFTSSVDFPTNGTDRFWSKYSNVVDAHLGTNSNIINAYKTGRAAISNKDLATKDLMRAIIKSELERVAAGAAIHYLNGAHSNFSNDAKRNHELTEAVAFMNCLRYNPDRTISIPEIDAIADLIGENLYEVTAANLTQARNTLSSKFGMDDVKEFL